MAQAELDVTKVMILLQRKWNAIQEMNRLTREMEDTFARNDEVSVDMLLQLREDEMGKVDHCMEEIWQMGEGDAQVFGRLCQLIQSDPEEVSRNTPEEKKICEIRKKTQSLLDELRKADQRLSQRMAGKKSFYKK